MKGCIVATADVSIRRSNRDLARAMLIVGIAIVAVGVLLSFADNWISTFYLSGDDFIRRFVVHAWSVIVQLAYPLGSFLIVGAIIVNRLPETASKHD